MSYAQYNRQYSTFSGVDIVATFADRLIGDLQGISFTSTREIAPLYTMGSKNPRGFSKGKRGIAGSLIFMTFDRESLLDTIKDLKHMRFVAKEHEVRQGFDGGRAEPIVKDIDANAFINETGEVSYQRGSADGSAYKYESLDYVLTSPMYYDEIPPFNVVLQAVNEPGQTMRMELRGVQIMNAGSRWQCSKTGSLSRNQRLRSEMLPNLSISNW